MLNRQSSNVASNGVAEQQDAFMGLMRTSLNAYMDLLRIPFSLYRMPFSFYQTELKATEAATRQAERFVEDMIRQTSEQTNQLTRQATQQAVQSATEQINQAARQAIEQAVRTATERTQLLMEQVILAVTEQAQLLTQQATLATSEQIKLLTEQVTQQAVEAVSQQVRQFAEQSALQVAQAAGTSAKLQREQAQIWNIDHPLQEAESDRAVLLEAYRPGIVHAGVQEDGKWIRTYDVPLEEASPDLWQAYLLDPEVNEFTFIWYDPDQPGAARWEGKNYQLPRRQKS